MDILPSEGKLEFKQGLQKKACEVIELLLPEGKVGTGSFHSLHSINVFG